VFQLGDIGSHDSLSRVSIAREAMFVALPRKVDTMFPRANLTRAEPNRSGSLSRCKGTSVCCALSVETVETALWSSGVSFAASINSRARLPRFDAGHEHGKHTNEFAAHEQLRAIDTQLRDNLLPVS
jgi:hypothetical protein